MFEICRSGQAEEEMLSGDETTATGDADPSPAAGVKPPVSDSTPAQNDDDAPTEQEPRQESNLGSRFNPIVHFFM